MNILILSTIPHFCSLYFVISDKIYFTIIILSSSFSITWHYCNEPKNYIFYIDYLLGLIWSIYEIFIVMIYLNEFLFYSISLNLCVLLTNLITDEISRKNILSYQYSHTIFHIVSFFKTTYLAYKINKT